MLSENIRNHYCAIFIVVHRSSTVLRVLGDSVRQRLEYTSLHFALSLQRLFPPLDPTSPAHDDALIAGAPSWQLL
jgi:hypothetical protein